MPALNGVVESWSDGQTRPSLHSNTPTCQDSAKYIPRTLRHDLKQLGRLPLSQCLEIGRHLASALAHLHAQGLVHRDVKPSNIVFVNGVPKLADIGLVAEASEARSFVGTLGSFRLKARAPHRLTSTVWVKSFTKSARAATAAI